MQENLYNIDFERSILSSILFDPEQFENVDEHLVDADFYLPAHQDIFKAMQILAHSERPIDETFVKKMLQAENKFDENIFIELLSVNPISNTAAYIKEVKEKAIKRNLLTLTTEIKRVTIEEEMPSDEVVNLVEKKLYEITQDSQMSDFKSAPEVTASTIAMINERKAQGNSILVGKDTGFHDLNRMTTGFGKGDLVIIAARPAMGKTSFVLNIVENLLKQGDGVAFFSLEMPAEQLMLRLLAIITSIPLQRLRLGDLSDEEWSSLNDAMAQMESSKLFVDDQGSVNIN